MYYKIYHHKHKKTSKSNNNLKIIIAVINVFKHLMEKRWVFGVFFLWVFFFHYLKAIIIITLYLTTISLSLILLNVSQ